MVERAILTVDTGVAVLGESSVAIELGNHYAVLSSDGRRILKFSSSGALVRIGGRDGSGPGELRRPDVMVALGSSGFVIAQGGRYLLFDPELKWQRSIVAAGLNCMLGLSQRRLACIGAQRPGGPFVVLDSMGTEVRRFGPHGGECWTCEGYLLTEANPRGDVVTVAALRHRVLEEWDIEGRRRRRIEYDLPALLGAQTEEGLELPHRLRLYGGWRDEEGNYFLVLNGLRETPKRNSAGRQRKPGSFTFDDFASLRSVALMIGTEGEVLGFHVWEGQRVLPAGASLTTRGRYNVEGKVEIVVETVGVPKAVGRGSVAGVLGRSGVRKPRTAGG